jgi:phage gp46-like protein
MTDVALRWIDGEADVVVDRADLLAEEGLETAVLLSLFLDARAEPSDQLPNASDGRRGWWGDQFSEVANDRIGSKLWLLVRAKRENETLERARRYSEEALAWMTDDGIASTIAVETSFVSIAELTASDVRPYEFALVIYVQVTKPDGMREAFRFAWQWQKQSEKVH